MAGATDAGGEAASEAATEAATARGAAACAGLPPIAAAVSEAACGAGSQGREGIEGGQIHRIYCACVCARVCVLCG